MKKFSITTSKETAIELEEYLKHYLSAQRCIQFESVTHDCNFSIVYMSIKDGAIAQDILSDVFFIGLFTGMNCKK